MHVGILVYSATGHTLSIAAQLKDGLSDVGHQVVLERLEAADSVGASGASVVLKASPDVSCYDALVFACPVRGGMPAPPMDGYLTHLSSLSGKRAACLVTGFFPVAAWGRDQTLARMKAISESKGAKVCGCGSVGWFSVNRRAQAALVVDELVRCFDQ